MRREGNAFWFLWVIFALYKVQELITSDEATTHPRYGDKGGYNVFLLLSQKYTLFPLPQFNASSYAITACGTLRDDGPL